MDDTTRRTEDTRTVRFTKDRDTLHKVGAPAEIVESAGFKKVIYAQNDKEHRAGGPSYLLIDKATGTTLQERWMQKDRVERAGGLPFETKRNRDGEIIQQSSDNGVKWQGPWHIDPDYAAIPDKPRAVDFEMETHYRGTADIIDGRFHADRAYIKHRDGNLPSEIIRSPGGTTQTFHLDNEEKRTDCGPTRIRINDSRAGGRPLVEQEWNTRLPGTRMDVPHREDGPASITLNHDGTIEEKWFKNGEAYTPNGHDLMRWASVKAQQGGSLWTEPENRHPDGKHGPTQVLVHPDTGVRFYEATHNLLGNLDRADGPSQIIRDQQTGATLFLAHHKNGEHHREGAAAVESFDRKTGKPTEQLWKLEGKPANPNGPAILRSHNGDRTYTGFAQDGRILYGRTIDNETGVVLSETDRRNDWTAAPTSTQRDEQGRVIFQEWRDSRYKQHRDNGPAVVAEGGHEDWYRNGRLYEPTEHENAHWAALKAQQGGLFWKPPEPEQATQPRPGGVKAAAAAAAAKATEPKATKPKATDRGDER